MKYFTLSLLTVFATHLIAQQNSAFEVKTFFAWQQHDKRFFGEREDKSIGTTQYGISINKTIAAWKRLSLQAGAGYARETNTYQTPYNHCFDNPGAPCTEVLAFIDKYHIDLLQTPVTLRYQLLQRFYLSFSLVPQVYFYKQVKGFVDVSQFKAGLYSIEYNPGIGYTAGRLHFNLGFRLFQLKTIDKVYLYGNNFLSKHPGYEDRLFDTHNPLKLMLGVGWRL